MQDWVLEQGSKTVCQIALKRRIQHIHSSHFLVFQISNGWSMWKVASANMQYLLFRGIWHCLFFFSILKTLKALEIHPSFHRAWATEHCEEGTGWGRGGGGWRLLQAPGPELESGAPCSSCPPQSPCAALAPTAAAAAQRWCSCCVEALCKSPVGNRGENVN